MRTLHLIQGASHCGALKIALYCAGERPYHVLYYPLPLCAQLLPHSTSQTELRRINHEHRKKYPEFRYGTELKQFFHPDLEQFNRVVVWVNTSNLNSDEQYFLQLVCRFFPACNLYQVQYTYIDLDNSEINYPDNLKKVTEEERAYYAAQYDEILKNGSVKTINW